MTLADTEKQEILVRTKPIHIPGMKNIGRAVWLEANGHTYRLWHDIHDYDKLEEEASALARDIGASYKSEPFWKEGDK